MTRRRSEWLDWCALAALTLAVYSTLSVARAAFDWLTHIGLGPALRVGVVAAVVAIPVGLALWLALVARVRRAADYAAIAALAAAYGVALLTLADMPIERVHLLEYGAVGLLAFRALRHRFGGTDRAILAALVALNIGLGDELIQGLLPRRFYDTKDVTANALAGLLAVLAAAVVSRGAMVRSAALTGSQDERDRQDSEKSIL